MCLEEVPAEPVIVDPGRVRDRGIDLRYPGRPAGSLGLIEVASIIEIPGAEVFVPAEILFLIEVEVLRVLTFAGLPIIGHYRLPAAASVSGERRRALLAICCQQYLDTALRAVRPMC